MIEISVSEVRAEIAEYLNRAIYAGEHIVITRHGKPVAVLIPYEEYKFSTETEERNS